jgi:uncharacterized protein YjiS (DUF1127 family)
MQKARFRNRQRVRISWSSLVARPPGGAASEKNIMLRGVPEMATNVITTQPADILAGCIPSPPSRRLGQLFARFDGWLEQRRRYRATVCELSALSDEVLADVGIMRGEIEEVARRLAVRPTTSLR